MIADFLHASIVNRIVLVRSTINKGSIMEIEEMLIFETILPSRHRVIHLVDHVQYMTNTHFQGILLILIKKFIRTPLIFHYEVY